MRSDDNETESMTKAWTFAVLDALESADDEIRLEIARILCPTGFAVVPVEASRKN
jgi:hypothetical protein